MAPPGDTRQFRRTFFLKPDIRFLVELRAQAQLDEFDKDLLNEIQWSFPLSPMPYEELAGRLGADAGEVMDRIRRLKSIGIIRQLSAIFDTRKLGYKSSLVAMKVAPGELERVAARISEHPGVSHNYERNHDYNLWFTIAVPPRASIQDEVNRFSKLGGVTSTRMLPTLRMFKIGVKLDMNEKKKREVKPSETKKRIRNEPFGNTERDRRFVRELQKDLPVTERPFAPMAQSLGVTEEELFKQARHYEETGVMRRYAAILRHRDAGFMANGMIVWKVPDDLIPSVGERLGAFPQVSHCYQRPAYPDWPYTVFSMIHCRSREEAAEMASTIQSQVGIPEYRILFSEREFKKSRVEYFVEPAPA